MESVTVKVGTEVEGNEARSVTVGFWAPDTRLATAYHEAGHAVASLVLGFAPESCTIVPSGSVAGSVTGPGFLCGHEGSSRRERNARARDEIVVLYAGQEAARIFGLDDPVWHGAGVDYHYARELLREHGLVRGRRPTGDEALSAALRRLQRKAQRLVSQHRAAIGRVAEMLLSRDTLTGEEIRGAVEGKGMIRRGSRTASPRPSR